ncbi:HK97 gp10 family phage protein [Streptomyces albidoflavus]
MSVSITFDWDEGAITRLLSSESGLVHRKIREVTENVADRCRVLAPNRDGRLRGSIKTAVRSSGDQVVGHVYSDLDYSLYVQRGTGLYGPMGQPIRPRRGAFLVFEAGGQTVFAREVRGTPPNPFMLDGLRAGSPWPVVALPG